MMSHVYMSLFVLFTRKNLLILTKNDFDVNMAENNVWFIVGIIYVLHKTNKLKTDMN